MRTNKRIALVAFTLFAVLFVGSAIVRAAGGDPDDAGRRIPAGRAGSLITHFADDVLVVVDAGTRRISSYEVTASGIRLVDRVSLDEKVKTPAEPLGTKTPALPKGDAPGQDPPGFPRIQGSVRVSSSHDVRTTGERWEGTYLVRGTLSELYGQIRRALNGWKIIKESATDQPQYQRAGVDFRAARHPDEIQVNLNARQGYPGWFVLSVTLSRASSE